MTVRISEVGANSLDRVNKILAGIPGGIWRATHSALQRAGATAKTRSGQFAAQEYTIRKGDFMSNVHQKTHISSDGGGVVSLSISYAGTVLPLLMFRTKYSRSGKLETQVKREGVSTMLDRVFAARVYGPLRAFERVGRERFPIQQKFGPSTAHMMQNPVVIQKMDQTIQETFDRRLEHEITRVLNGWGG